MKRLLIALLPLALASSSCAARSAGTPEAAPVAPAAAQALPEPASPVTWIVTTAGAPFVRSSLPPLPEGAEAEAAAALVSVDPRQTRQAIDGFGGAFNEQGWAALGLLAPSERDEVLRALFDPEQGLLFTHGRAPIGASDYALERYTLDEAPGDYAMAKFSIERDRKLLIPFIRAALALRPDLKLWASAWTPPTWMKDNAAYDSGAFRDEPEVYAAYALYLARYVESYAAEGIGVSMLVPQNEPGQLTHYPSCDWRPEQYVTFIRDHLAPTLARRHLSTQIFVGTINKADWDVMHVLRDPGTAAVIAGAAFQWNGLAQVAPVHAAFPNLPLMQSETECGNSRKKPGFNPDRPPNDFAYAAYTFGKFRDFIAAGASSYMLWNMVLDEQGKNIDTERPWPQNAAIVVDRASRSVVYTPMFWVTKHFSALVDVGARLIASGGNHADSIAFINPDGTLVVELLNAARTPLALRVEVGGRRHAVELPAESVGTLLIPNGGA
jgi:glucosylceramidase